MAVAYSITPELRIRLKKPIGKLIRGSFTETIRLFKGIIEKEKPSVIISVGDTVTRNIVRNHVLPQLSIVDNRVMRKITKPLRLATENVVCVKNPPGTITEESMMAIREALKSNCRVKIVVDGEEDLLALIAVLFAPENSYVIYGQPYEGVVAVKVTQEKRAEIAEILKAMETVRKAK